MNTTQHLDIPLQIAETEIMRAKQKVIVEKNNGMSFGNFPAYAYITYLH
jgi:hypothetical protein